MDDRTAEIFMDYDTQVFVSSVSVMEFVHLLQNGRITSKRKHIENIITFIEEEMGCRILYTNRHHLLQYAEMPVVAGHNDPNDRLIIAQAICDRLELVSSDTKFPLYRKYGLRFVQAKKQM